MTIKATAPAYSKKRVTRAGDAIRQGRISAEDILVVDNWRACHNWILNTFQANLRRRAKKKPITVAQRLKRRVTIFDKLKREQGMQLARMNDIAGCRVIFNSEAELIEFRTKMHQSRMKHVLRNGNDDPDNYNYILKPKETGYRGVHDIYQYRSYDGQASDWDNLLIEIQYRTVFQHAWATAVEVADLIGSTRIKFDDADQLHSEFFKIASELVARKFEGRTSCYPDIDWFQLKIKLLEIERRIMLLDAFKNIQEAEPEFIFKQNMILIVDPTDDTDTPRLSTRAYETMPQAIAAYEQLEKELPDTVNLVLVRAANPENMREAFRNYFSDVKGFLQYIDEALATHVDPLAKPMGLLAALTGQNN